VTGLFSNVYKADREEDLVVGAGKIGGPKIGGLIDAGAHIHLVTIEASGEVREWADSG
jgi:siroheme synthase (precorrin-2 oxidase/ferrochelatase)